MAVFEMKELLRRKILHTAQCIEEGRTSNLSSDIEGVVSMACQLSSITNIDESLNILECILSMLPEIRDSTEVRMFSRPNLVPGHKGRPSFHIPIDVLEFLPDSRFKVQDIADMLGVGKRTIERRLQQVGLSVSKTYSDINDIELGEKIRKIVVEFPHVGYRTVLSILATEGFRVQEHRVRDALRKADSEGTLFRRLFLTTCRAQRRTYSVSGPQALWHIDGNHKLIRWRFVIHGVIDGFSRMPVFFKVSNNNKTETVLDAFMEAVSQYGLPKRVRSDKGGENVKVAEYMFSRRGTVEKPFIARRSVHNQRIERLWREL